MSEMSIVDALIGMFTEDYVKKPCNAEKFILAIDEEDKTNRDPTIEELIEILK